MRNADWIDEEQLFIAAQKVGHAPEGRGLHTARSLLKDLQAPRWRLPGQLCCFCHRLDAAVLEGLPAMQADHLKACS